MIYRLLGSTSMFSSKQSTIDAPGSNSTAMDDKGELRKPYSSIIRLAVLFRSRNFCRRGVSLNIPAPGTMTSQVYDDVTVPARAAHAYE